MDVKIGDVVHVRRTITQITGTENRHQKITHFNIGTSQTEYWVPVEDIIYVEPRRPLEIGDTVHVANFTVPYVIKAIDGDEAWLWSQSGHHYTVNIATLHRAD